MKPWTEQKDIRGSSLFWLLSTYPLKVQKPQVLVAFSRKEMLDQTLGKGSVTTERQAGVDPLKDTVWWFVIFFAFSMSFATRLAAFLVCFFVIGVVGYALDLFTGGRFYIRKTLYNAKDVAWLRTVKFVGLLRSSWIWSPVFFLSLVISPVFFAFVFIVFLYDSYVGDALYSEDGKRFALKGGPLTEETILINPKPGPTRSFGAWVTSLWVNKGDGVVVAGEEIPHGWAAEGTLDAESRKKALKHSFRRYGISGNYWYAPPADRDQNVGLDAYED